MASLNGDNSKGTILMQKWAVEKLSLEVCKMTLWVKILQFSPCEKFDSHPDFIFEISLWIPLVYDK